MSRRIWVVLFLFSASSLSQASLAAEQKEEPKSKRNAEFVFKDRPSLRFGKTVRLELQTKLQFDFLDYSPDLKSAPNKDDPFEISRARFGVLGNVTQYVEYEVEREFRGNFGEDRPANLWKDVYVNLKLSRPLNLKVGKFKVPFGMEQNTSAAKLDFVRRSLASDFLTSGRDKGIMLYGKFLKGDRLSYEAGMFRADGEVAIASGKKSSQRAWVARITGEPLRLLGSLPKTLHKVILGAAAETSQVFEGENGLRGQSASGATFFPHLQVNGNRLRLGAELKWEEGPISVRSEFINVRQERRNQSIRVQDLSDMFARGWYASAAWTVLGEKKSGGGEPKNAFLTGHGPGAVELAARFEVLRFDSTDRTGRESRSPRAANILGNSDRAWTLGANWYVNRFVKFQVNGIRETIEDPQRSPIFGRQRYWTALARLQVSM